MDDRLFDGDRSVLNRFAIRQRLRVIAASDRARRRADDARTADGD